MRHLLLSLSCLLLFVACSSPKAHTTTSKSPYKYRYEFRDDILVGKIPVSAIRNDTTNFGWFNDRYTSYNVKTNFINRIQPVLDSISFDVFLGTWCSDTKLVLPKFIKILDALNYNINTVNYYALNKNKAGLNNKLKENDIKYVPTIIIYKNNLELNRIIEYHIESIEADLLNILTTNTYKHPFSD